MINSIIEFLINRLREKGMLELSDRQLSNKLGISIGDVRSLRRLKAISLGTLLTLCRKLDLDILIYSKKDLNLKLEARK